VNAQSPYYKAYNDNNNNNNSTTYKAP